MKLFNFKKHHNRIISTIVEEQNKIAAETPKVVANPAETVIDNLHSPDYGKKVKETTRYQMDVYQKENRQEPMFVASEVTQSVAKSNIVEWTTTQNISKATPVYFVKYGYYLLFDKSQVFILTNSQKARLDRTNTFVCVPDILKVDTRETTSGKQATPGYRIIQDGQSFNSRFFRDLTRKEYENILTSKPSYDELLAVYALYENEDNLEINTAIATPIW